MVVVAELMATGAGLRTEATHDIQGRQWRMKQRERHGDVGLNDRIFLIPGCIGCQHVTKISLPFIAIKRIDALAARAEADGVDVVNAACRIRSPKEILHLSPDVLIQARDANVGRAGSKEVISRISLYRVRDDGQSPVVEEGFEFTQSPVEGRRR